MSLIRAALFALIFAFTLNSFADVDDTAVVATIGDKKITKKEFNEKYRELATRAFNPPTKEEFLEDLVRYEVGMIEAEKIGLDKDPVVKERFRQVMYADLLEKEIGKKVDKLNPTQKEMQEYYAKNPDIRTSHILIEIKPNANEQERAAAKKRAEEIYADVKKSKRPFAELVKLYSDDIVSKKVGGDVGWHSSLTLVPEYYDAAVKLSVNQISPLIESRFGFHIIKLTGKKSFREADKAQIKTAVIEQKRAALLNDFFGKLKSKYSVKEFTQKL